MPAFLPAYVVPGTCRNLMLILSDYTENNSHRSWACGCMLMTRDVSVGDLISGKHHLQTPVIKDKRNERDCP